MITETQERKYHSQSRNPNDLTFYKPAKKLVGRIFYVVGVDSEPFLQIMSWLKAHIPEVPQNRAAHDAILNLTVAAYKHSGSYYKLAQGYADSLWTEPQSNEESDRPANDPELRGEATEKKESHLSELTQKVLKISEWATTHKTPSLKIDLMAALVDADDDLIIEALLVALQGKGGKA